MSTHSSVHQTALGHEEASDDIELNDIEINDIELNAGHHRPLPTPSEIRNMRIFMGMEPEELADEMDVNPFTIRRWENGSNNISAASAQQLRELYEKKMGFDEV